MAVAAKVEIVAEAVEKEAVAEPREAVLERAEVVAGARLVVAPLAVTGLAQQATSLEVVEGMRHHQSKFVTLQDRRIVGRIQGCDPPNEKQRQRAKSMNTRHCISAHPPNPPFQPTRVDVWRVHSGSFPRGRLNGGVRHPRPVR